MGGGKIWQILPFISKTVRDRLIVTMEHMQIGSQVTDRSVSVPITLKGVKIFGRISIITPKRFDLEQRNLVW